LKNYKEIFCTLGPSTLNKSFLSFSNKKVDLLRLNLSHVSIAELKKLILFIRRFSKVPICIDTEGAQIRTKVKKKINYKEKQELCIFKNKGNLSFYPPEIFSQIKKGDIFSIGFEGLEVKVIKIKPDKIYVKTTKNGFLENNKGVHLVNRKIKLNFITEKDRKAILIAKKMNIKYFALSFTNTHNDILKFNSLLKNKIKIFKLETKSALKNLNKIMSAGERFLIDRGDLSKDVSIEMLPVIQRKIINAGKIKRKKVYVATNFLESMVKNRQPNRGEANDIYNTLESGASGLVLAAETAIGKYPKECVFFLKKIIKVFNNYKS
jgi:pyruvate kinase